jgi:hypothetical protein
MSAAGGDKHGENAGDCQQDGDQRHGQTTGFLFGIDHVPLLDGAPAAEVAAGGIGCFGRTTTLPSVVRRFPDFER